MATVMRGTTLLFFLIYMATSAGPSAPRLHAQGTAFHNAPASAAAEKNPYDGQASAIAAGKTSYASHCAACHGVTAEGTGNVPPLAHGALQGVPDGAIFWYITKGGLENGMPSWAALPAEERWQLVTFVKSMSASATSTAPAASSAPEISNAPRLASALRFQIGGRRSNRRSPAGKRVA
jgi:mono/diheme cytochrome c family protein